MEWEVYTIYKSFVIFKLDTHENMNTAVNATDVFETSLDPFSSSTLAPTST